MRLDYRENPKEESSIRVYVVFVFITLCLLAYHQRDKIPKAWRMTNSEYIERVFFKVGNDECVVVTGGGTHQSVVTEPGWYLRPNRNIHRYGRSSLTKYNHVMLLNDEQFGNVKFRINYRLNLDNKYLWKYLGEKKHPLKVQSNLIKSAIRWHFARKDWTEIYGKGQQVQVAKIKEVAAKAHKSSYVKELEKYGLSVSSVKFTNLDVYDNK